jgi:hypothetical protein
MGQCTKHPNMPGAGVQGWSQSHAPALTGDMLAKKTYRKKDLCGISPEMPVCQYK